MAATDSDRAHENKGCSFLLGSCPTPTLPCGTQAACTAWMPQTCRGPPKRPQRLAAGGTVSQRVSEFTSQRRKHMLLGPTVLLTDVSAA